MVRQKRVILLILAAITACIGWMCATQIADEETRFPAGAQVQTWADFTGSSLSKHDAIKMLATLAHDTDARIILTHTGSDQQTVDLIAWGNSTPEVGTPVPWFSSKRHGIWLSDAALETASLNGSYAFSNMPAATAFSSWLVSEGGSVGELSRRPDTLSFASMQSNSGAAYALLSLAMLLIALSWEQACRQYRARMIRVMGGITPYRAQSADMLMNIVPALPVIAGTCIFMIVALGFIHHWNGINLLIPMFLQSALLMTIAYAIACITCVFIMRPHIKDIASRSLPYAKMHCGNGILCASTVALAMISFAIGMGAIAQYDLTIANLEAWKPLSRVVSADVSASTTDAFTEENASRIHASFKELDDDEAMALSMPVGVFFTPSQGEQPTIEQVHAATSPYDDVIICNPAFLSMFNVHGSELRSIDSRDIPSSLSEGIHAYNDLWLTSGASPMEQHLFRWNSSRAFPSLSYGAQTGTITHTTNPLIIVVNDISTSLNLEGFLIPAMSTANLVFANADVLHQAFGRHGVNSLITSTSTIADSVYARTLWLRQTIATCAIAMTVAIIAALLVAAFAARTWSLERQRALFVRHVSGYTFTALTCKRTIVCGLLLIAVTALASFVLPNWSIVDPTRSETLFFLLFAAVGAAFNTLITIHAARSSFREAIHRH